MRATANITSSLLAEAKSEWAMKLWVESEMTFRRMRFVTRITKVVMRVCSNVSDVGKNTGIVTMPMMVSTMPVAALKR
ncbi:hypothetical protein D3C80_1802320 [compost metagenome]